MKSRRWLRNVLLVVGYVTVFAGQAALTRTYYTLPNPGGNDFYPRWAGGCLWLRQGANPYAPSTTLAIQEGVYGRPALVEEDQVAFAYPIYTVLFTWPLCLTTDFSVARAVWMTALTHMLVLGTILASRMTGWRPSWRLWPWVLAWSVLVYPNARAVLLGQLSVVVFLLVLAALEALRTGRNGLAGALLALSTVKPQMVLLTIPWLLLWSAAHRRWGAVVGFAASLALLVALPMLALPTWLTDFATQLRAYTSYTELRSVTWIITSYYLDLPEAIEWVITLGLLAWLAREAIRARHLDVRSMLWTTSLAMVLTHFVAPRTATTHFALLVVPLFLGFTVWSQAHSRSPDFVPAAVLAILFVGTWWLFLATVEGRQESAATYLPIPLVLVCFLPWIRNAWMRLSPRPG